MFLKEIKLSGFKSFADRTRMILEPGVTCIVGPNGCGKSNIVDAIRWVLGEQSAKAMRAGKMQDVIFEGSQNRKPMGMCEVALVFTDCEEQLGIGFNEVEVMRRVTREGSSDYFLNGKACRLKDIQRLFMDTGIGRVSYSFLVQGQIDQILSSNPQERRAIFEEAAGITKYKSQRHEAMLKLNQVDQNLSRVKDVITEMNRQMGSLERQAKKALRYQKLKHQAVHLELAEQSYQYGVCDDACKALDEKLKHLRASVSTESEALEKKELILKADQLERTHQYEALQTFQQTLYGLQSSRQEAMSKSQLAKTRLEDSRSRQSGFEKELAHLLQTQSQLGTQVEASDKEQSDQAEVVRHLDAIFQEKNSALSVADQNLQEAQRAFGALRQKVTNFQSQRAQFQTELNRCEVELRSQEHVQGELKGTLEPLKAELATAEQRLAEAANVQAQRLAEFEAAKKSLADVQESVKSSQLAEQSAKAKLTQAQSAQNKIAAELGALEALKARHEGLGTGTKALLQSSIPGVIANAVKLLCGDLKVKKSDLTGVEALLGLALEGLSLSKGVNATDIAAAMSGQKLSRVCVHLPSFNAAQHASKVALPSGIRSAVDAIESASEEVKALLANRYLFDDLSTFLEWTQSHSEFNFACAAGINGELIDSRGLLFLGKENESAQRAAVLERETQIATLKEKLSEARAKADEATRESEAAVKSFSEAQQVVEKSRHTLGEAQHTLSIAQAQHRLAVDLHDRAQSALKKREQAFNEAQQKRQAAAVRFEKAQTQFNACNTELGTAEQSYSTTELALEEQRVHRQKLHEDASVARLSLMEAQQKLTLLTSNVRQVKDQIASILQRAESIRLQQRALDTDQSTFAAQAAEQIELAQKLEAQLQEGHVLLGESKTKLTELERIIREQEQVLGSMRSALRENEQVLSSQEVRRAEQHAQVVFLEERIRTEFNQEVGLIDWRHMLALACKLPENKALTELEKTESEEEAEPPPQELSPIDVSAVNWVEIRQQVKELRTKLSNLGAVNLVAIEEYDALKQRYDFLKAQCLDLEAAKADLLTAIEEINRTCETYFKETFEKVRENFSRTFVKLFGGGHAHLELVESENMLEAGIEIVACPPGTRMKSLTLLSGGQKTMTAVALLFAIYQVKPSPFCVLDELDAPLDDANIGRFTQMLREFTEFSQFMVITHNKRTLAAADSIYGVTMPERGITQLVSMRFEALDDVEALA
jgi:chromosome segregation protein